MAAAHPISPIERALPRSRSEVIAGRALSDQNVIRARVREDAPQHEVGQDERIRAERLEVQVMYEEQEDCEFDRPSEYLDARCCRRSV